jgi:hypothetical protein
VVKCYNKLKMGIDGRKGVNLKIIWKRMWFHPQSVEYFSKFKFWDVHKILFFE